MPRIETAMGEVIVYDGDNAAEIAAACDVDQVPQPTIDGAITLLVPRPIGPAEEATLAPGDGLVVREAMGGFLPIPAEQIAMFKLPAEA